jgi:hypothetical protein
VFLDDSGLRPTNPFGDAVEARRWYSVRDSFVVGLGMILLGVVFMLIMRARQAAFFRGETLRKDTPVLVVDAP